VVENLRDLELLVLSHTPIIAIESSEEDRVRARVEALAARLDLPWLEWKATVGLSRAGSREPLHDTEKPFQALRIASEMQTEALYLFHDLDKYFEDPAILRALRDIGERFTEDRRALILCAPEISVPVDLRTCTALLQLELPDLKDLKGLAVRTLRALGAPRRIKIDLSLPEIEQLVASLRGLTLAEAQRVLMRSALDDLRLNREDFSHILEQKKALIARDGILELYPEEETLQQIGGLERLKDWLRKRGVAFSAEAQRQGLEPPRGLLLLGVQGCGKSLCAKAIASLWGLALLRFDAGALYDKYVGESEKNLRRAMRTAEAMAPCVLWIDEIEKGMSGREGSASDGGLSKRILGAFLSWLQEKTRPVFVAATANDIQALPPELLRKGRFDEIFFVDLPDDGARRAIFAVHLVKRRQDPSRFDLGALAAASEGWSGSEIEAAIVSALYAAFAEKRPLVTADILAEARAAVPLSRTCREQIQELRAWARGRAVPAGAEAGHPSSSAA
jgi:ATP-dependent 26S proteasome regulatory subunit